MTAGLEFERAIRPNPEALARLELSHADAVAAGIALREKWRQEDAEIAEARRFIWAAHEQGARDRDAMRVKLGGRSLIEADRQASAAHKAAQDAKAAEDARAAKAASDAEAKKRAELADKAEADAAKLSAAQNKTDAKAETAAAKAEAKAEARSK
jgi:hypothetical protein